MGLLCSLPADAQGKGDGHDLLTCVVSSKGSEYLGGDGWLIFISQQGGIGRRAFTDIVAPLVRSPEDMIIRGSIANRRCMGSTHAVESSSHCAVPSVHPSTYTSKK